MAREYFEHITTKGDRWDLIAFDYYGDASLMHHILLANPNIIGGPDPAPLVFEAGVRIFVPVLAEEEVRKVQLPPWKQQ